MLTCKIFYLLASNEITVILLISRFFYRFCMHKLKPFQITNNALISHNTFASDDSIGSEYHSHQMRHLFLGCRRQQGTISSLPVFLVLVEDAFCLPWNSVFPWTPSSTWSLHEHEIQILFRLKSHVRSGGDSYTRLNVHFHFHCKAKEPTSCWGSNGNLLFFGYYGILRAQFAAALSMTNQSAPKESRCGRKGRHRDL